MNRFVAEPMAFFLPATDKAMDAHSAAIIKRGPNAKGNAPVIERAVRAGYVIRDTQTGRVSRIMLAETATLIVTKMNEGMAFDSIIFA